MEASASLASELSSNNAKKQETNAKLKIGQEKKDAADKAFKEGDTKTALRLYHEATLYVQGVDKSVLNAVNPQEKSEGSKRTEADVLLEKIQSNICACHIKNENWKRALETANQILKKSPENKKAKFRQGKAFLGQGFTEKAIEVFEALEKQDPIDLEIKRELALARTADKAATSKGLNKFKGFLNKPGKTDAVLGSVEGVANVLQESKIEEIHD